MKTSIQFQTLSAAALVAALTFAASSAGAEVVPTPGKISTYGTTLASHSYLSGTTIADTDRNFTFVMYGVTYSGFVEDRVVRETSSGTLAFYFSVVFNTPPPSNLYDLAVDRTSYVGYTADVNYRLDGTGICAPTTAQRWAPTLGDVYFNFLNPNIGVGSANSTYFTYVRTTATTYNAGGTMSITSYLSPQSVKVPCYQPG